MLLQTRAVQTLRFDEQWQIFFHHKADPRQLRGSFRTGDSLQIL